MRSLAASALVGLAVCPPALAATNPPSTAAVDACTLITASEFADLMAGAVGTPVAAQTTTGSSCTVAYPQHADTG